MENAGIREKIRSASAFVSSRSDRDENWSDIPIKSQLCDIRRPGSELQNIMDGRNAAARSSIITGTLRRIGRRKQTFSLSLFFIRRKYMRKDLPSESSVHIRWISSQKCVFLFIFFLSKLRSRYRVFIRRSEWKEIFYWFKRFISRRNVSRRYLRRHEIRSSFSAQILVILVLSEVKRDSGNIDECLHAFMEIFEKIIEKLLFYINIICLFGIFKQK